MEREGPTVPLQARAVRQVGATEFAATRTFKSHGGNLQNQNAEELAKNIARLYGSPKNVEFKSDPDKKNSQYVTINNDRYHSYTVLVSKNFDEDLISIGTPKETLYVHRKKGAKEWASGGKYGKIFNTLEDLEKWLKK